MNVEMGADRVFLVFEIVFLVGRVKFLEVLAIVCQEELGGGGKERVAAVKPIVKLVSVLLITQSITLSILFKPTHCPLLNSTIIVKLKICSYILIRSINEIRRFLIIMYLYFFD